jgi:23S rRNA (uracil1939-C5)-methyltransferase
LRLNSIPAAETIEIEKLVYGGAGLGRRNGKVWLVPMTAPGEVVEALPLRDRGNRVEAGLAGIIRPSPDRREPPCRYYSVCGGCQLQHLTYQAQCEARRGFVAESLAREGVDFPAEPEFLPSPFEFGYRNRVQLTVREGRVGFLRRHSAEIVEIEECPLLLPGLSDAIPTLRKDAGKAGAASFPMGQLFAMEGERGELSAEPAMGGTYATGARWTVGGIGFQCSPDTFFQANAMMLDTFQALVAEGLSGSAVLDLYGGNGFFSLPLARCFKSVTIVEENRSSIALGKLTAKNAGIGNARFMPARVEDIDPAEITPLPELVIADPTRSGLSNKAMGVLLAISPRDVTYVSCDPTSMARDLRKLGESGYGVRRVSILDMFPQTFHVETAVFLSKQGG